MAENAFLLAIEAHLAGAALTPAPATIGAAEPTASSDLPAIVLSLEDVTRPKSGLGSRSDLVTDGALPVAITIDLAAAVLPGDPDFDLVDDDRDELVLYHGGLVRADGSVGSLGPSDLTITIDGGPVVPRAIDPQVGRVSFDAPLPSAGSLRASYFIGQWERRVVRLSGVLRADVLDTDAAAVRSLASAAVESLVADGAGLELPGLLHVSVRSLSSVGAPGDAVASARRQSVRLEFEYEHRIDRPESSGGTIQRIPVTSDVGVG